MVSAKSGRKKFAEAGSRLSNRFLSGGRPRFFAGQTASRRTGARGNCLAESWSASEDGLSYEFVLRQGAKFHNGEPVTADDVKFSFERYRGASHDLIKNRVAAVETPDASHVRFKLKQPWPDFLTFYATASGAGWIVPKNYVEKVGDEGFKKAPIGAGPYKFVSFTPGLELIFKAFDQYWRKTPTVKRLVFKVIPEETTRLAALKQGEIDIVYSIRGELAEELRATPGLTLKPVVPQGPWWLYFSEQWDPKSPWHDERVRRAASLAIDRKAINDAITLGYSKITGSIIPYTFEYFWQPPEPTYDPGKARQLLAEAGYPGEHYVDSSYSNFGEAVLDNLLAVGIRAKASAAGRQRRRAMQPQRRRTARSARGVSTQRRGGCLRSRDRRRPGSDPDRRATRLRIIEMAGDEATFDVAELRLLLPAARHRVRAARVEAAAGGWVQRARHLAGKDDLLAPLIGMGRQSRRKQRLGVGMLRRTGESARVPGLDYLAQIHDRDRVAHMRDRGEVVGDE
jgi:hypothetical protein